MAGSLNRVQLIGRCTADPEMRYLPSGQPVTQLRIATNRYSSSQDGERREFTYGAAREDSESDHERSSELGDER